jgi:hypothetical protein
MTDLPYHGGNQDLPDSLVNRILTKNDSPRRARA